MRTDMESIIIIYYIFFAADKRAREFLNPSYMHGQVKKIIKSITGV